MFQFNFKWWGHVLNLPNHFLDSPPPHVHRPKQLRCRIHNCTPSTSPKISSPRPEPQGQIRTKFRWPRLRRLPRRMRHSRLRRTDTGVWAVPLPRPGRMLSGGVYISTPTRWPVFFSLTSVPPEFSAVPEKRGTSRSRREVHSGLTLTEDAGSGEQAVTSASSLAAALTRYNPLHPKEVRRGRGACTRRTLLRVRPLSRPWSSGPEPKVSDFLPPSR